MKRKLFVIAICLLYTTAYGFFAVANINPEGTGTAMFLLPLATWFLILAAFYLAMDELQSAKRTYFVILLAVHYISISFLAFTYLEELYEGESRLLRAFEINGAWALASICVYLFGQVVLWVLFVHDSKVARIR